MSFGIPKIKQMKKIKLLFFILLVILVINLFKLYTVFFNTNPEVDLTFHSSLETLFFTIYIVILIVFFASQFFIAKGLWVFTKKGFFNLSSIKTLRIGGLLLLTYGIVVFFIRIYYVFSIQSLTSFATRMNLYDTIQDGHTIVLGFVIVIITDVLRNGLILKEENRLTI